MNSINIIICQLNLKIHIARSQVIKLIKIPRVLK